MAAEAARSYRIGVDVGGTNTDVYQFTDPGRPADD